MQRKSPNKVKNAAFDGGPIKGIHLTFPANDVIELVGAHVDFIYFDCEHGTFTGSQLADGCRTAALMDCTPIARLPNFSSSTITHFLDRGVQTLIFPHVESADQARAIVDAAYFAPRGNRSYGAGRPEFAFGDDPAAYFQACNERTSVSIMIESKVGLDACAEIAAVDGVDYMSFGLFDLAQSLGYQSRTDHPEFRAIVNEAADRIRAAGKPMREDFLKYAFINDIIKAGMKAVFDVRI